MEDPGIIYQKYSKKIYNLAYRMTGNEDDANDIMHDTFVQGLVSIDQFREESTIYTWLYRIAKNKCLRFLEKRNRSTFESFQALIDQNSSTVHEELTETEKTTYIAQVKEGCLSGLLRCLSLPQRIAFILVVLLDLPLVQVATILDKTENATRILVHRSKQNIKDFLCCNCSLYDPKNHCRCENLINFSLKQGWIGLNNGLVAEKEIAELKSVISLYRSLDELSPSVEFDKRVYQLLAERKDLILFSDKKVK